VLNGEAFGLIGPALPPSPLSTGNAPTASLSVLTARAKKKKRWWEIVVLCASWGLLAGPDVPRSLEHRL